MPSDRDFLVAGLAAMAGDWLGYEHAIRNLSRHHDLTCPHLKDEPPGRRFLRGLPSEEQRLRRWWMKRKFVLAAAEVQHQTHLVQSGEALARELV